VPTFVGKLCDSDLEALEALRKACHGLLPSWQNPHRFFEQRSEITSGLTKLLRLLGSDPRPLTRVPRPINGTCRFPGHSVTPGGRERFPPAPEAPVASPAGRYGGGLLTLTPPPEVLEPVEAFRRQPKRERVRRHRYPMPPRGTEGQGDLLLGGNATV
jgi:hypothetical protein